ncbi:MAG: hypothetical protein HYV26_07020 [Candidatus Hydrogenedentes bacterium]|nr:hypothetical protein [Candidatus Hydrogenedentota bacterium]
MERKGGVVALQGYDILAFTYADWHASWSTPQQLMSRLAPQNRILFVDQPRSFLYGLKPPDPQGAGVWQGLRLQEVRPNLFVYHPPHCFLPVGRLPLSLAKATLRLNGRRLARLVGKQMRKLGIHRPILWNFSPLHGKAVPHLPRRLTLYDICDEWASYVPDRSGKEVLAWIEEALTRQADLVFVGSENMLQKRAGLNPEMHVVYHAADFVHFSRAASPNTAVPQDLAGLPRPVIGAIGVLDAQRFDVELVAAPPQARPAWSFALVGPARPGLDLLQ